jgi:zinc protease
VYLGTRPKNVTTAVEAVREEVERFRSEGPTGQEVADTKSFLRSLLPFQMQTYSQIGTLLLNLEFFDLPADYYETYGARLDRVTEADVFDAARTFLDLDNSCLTVTGPVDDNLAPVKRKMGTSH